MPDNIDPETREYTMKKTLTPHMTYFETSQPLTEEQIAKLNFFIEEILFDEEDEENIPEITSEVEQHNTIEPYFNN